MDSEDAEIENKTEGGSTLLCVFERGCNLSSVAVKLLLPVIIYIS